MAELETLFKLSDGKHIPCGYFTDITDGSFLKAGQKNSSFIKDDLVFACHKLWPDK